MSAPNFHVVNALPPVADAFSTSSDSDIIRVEGEGILFVIQQGATAGAAANTVTVEACSNISAGATQTVPFIYRECIATDVWGDWTASDADGFSAVGTVANSMWQIYVDAAELAEEGYGYVRLSTDETAAHAVLAGVLAIVINGRFEPRATTLLT